MERNVGCNEALQARDIQTNIVNGNNEIQNTIADICEAAGVLKLKKSKKDRPSIELDKIGITVDVRKNVDVKGKDNNVEVKITYTDEEGYDDFRIISVNGACENEEYIRQTLLNMTFIDEDGEVSKAIMDYVKRAIKARKFNLIHSIIGWGISKGEIIFKLFRIHNNQGGEYSNYVGNLMIRKKGEHEGYINGLRKLVVGKPKRELAFVTGAYGILLQSLGVPDCNLIINFYGKGTKNNKNDSSGLGKSTSVKLATQLFGNANELFRSHNITDNKSEVEMAEHSVVPYILDDKLVTSIGKSERRLASDLVKFVFRFTTGRVKRRLNPDRKSVV